MAHVQLVFWELVFVIVIYISVLLAPIIYPHLAKKAAIVGLFFHFLTYCALRFLFSKKMCCSKCGSRLRLVGDLVVVCNKCGFAFLLNNSYRLRVGAEKSIRDKKPNPEPEK